MEFTVKQQKNKLRLDKYLTDKLDITRSQIQKQIKIENYSEKTIKNYLSAHNIKKVTCKVVI